MTTVGPEMKPPSAVLFRTVSAVALVFTVLISACSPKNPGNSDILIGLHAGAIPRLHDPQGPDPGDTGIPSLDTLNQKWGVIRMVPLFPEISPDDEVAARQGLAGIYRLTIPPARDLDSLLADYRSDENVEFAEFDRPFEVK